MSDYLAKRNRTLPLYVPGEHAQGQGTIRLNTNESPYPPSPGVAMAVAEAARGLNFYNDPDAAALHRAFARVLGIDPACVMATNGSDEAIYLAFLAFANGLIALPDVTYGYYSLFAALHGIPLHRIPVRADFSINPQDYIGLDEMIVLANPNAPTGLALEPKCIADICAGNPKSVVLLDEAYVDFGAHTALQLIEGHPNLLIVRTFSKSRSLAGARIGFAVGDPALIADMKRIHNAAGLYSVSAMAQAAGVAACEENDYYEKNEKKIIATRERMTRGLRALGFEAVDSMGNFVFARHSSLAGRAVMEGLAHRGVLVRWFDEERTRDYVRISVGTDAQADALLVALEDLLKEAYNEKC